MSDAAALWYWLLLAVGPGVFFAWFFYRRDKWEQEPPLLVAGTFVLGGLSVLPVLGVGVFASAAQLLDLGPNPWRTVLLAPLLEEPAKLLAVVLLAYRHREFNEPMDGIVYGTAAALGFASVENVMYVLDALDGGVAHAEWVVLLRAGLSVPGHALFAMPWALALGLARFTPDRPRGRRMILKGLVLGMAFHAAHNLLAVLSPTIGSIYLVLLAVVLWAYAVKRMRLALAQSPFAPEGAEADRSA